VIGNFEKEGAVNDTDTTPPEPPEAEPIVGAVEGPLVEPCAPRIGMLLFYLTLLHVIVGGE
jgi:hypothetical protein